MVRPNRAPPRPPPAYQATGPPSPPTGPYDQGAWLANRRAYAGYREGAAAGDDD